MRVRRMMREEDRGWKRKGRRWWWRRRIFDMDITSIWQVTLKRLDVEEGKNESKIETQNTARSLLLSGVPNPPPSDLTGVTSGSFFSFLSFFGVFCCLSLLGVIRRFLFLNSEKLPLFSLFGITPFFTRFSFFTCATHLSENSA